MTKKPSKPKKAKLKRGVDATKLVEELEKLLNEGRALMEQPIIDETDYNNWYNHVVMLLETNFTDSENEYKRRFIGPAGYILVRQDGVSSIQPDQLFALRSDLGDQLSSFPIIIDDIRIRFVKMKKTTKKHHTS